MEAADPPACFAGTAELCQSFFHHAVFVLRYSCTPQSFQWPCGRQELFTEVESVGSFPKAGLSSQGRGLPSSYPGRGLLVDIDCEVPALVPKVLKGGALGKETKSEGAQKKPSGKEPTFHLFGGDPLRVPEELSLAASSRGFGIPSLPPGRKVFRA